MTTRFAEIDTEFFAAERAADFTVIGTAAPRSDARGHVTGQTRYFEDVQYPGMLHVVMHRSARHHALITDVDISGALATPGVQRVLTHKDVPNNWYTILRLIGVQPDDEPVLAEDRVLYMGEPICAVIADTEANARLGASRIAVTYEDLPAVFDVEEALLPDAPVVNPRHGDKNYFTYEGYHCRRIRFGDVEKAFAGADRIYEYTYESSPIEHAPLEMTGCIVKPEGERLLIHSDTQACYFTLDNTALTLDVPFNTLRVQGGTVGGGFGGKVDVMVEPIACIAAQLTNRPVKYVYSRAEEMQVSSPRAAERIRIKDGVMADGRIIARKVT
ncbi:MAG: molybdopterin-dependent oxidoreductase, partial [Thermomicrobiales bacterium]